MNTKQIGLLAVVSIGIGSMLGSGIFALLGDIVLEAGKFSYLVVILTGLIALLSGYAYAKVGAKFATTGGMVDFFQLDTFPKRVGKILGVLYLFTASVVIAIVAKAFAGYLALSLSQSSSLWIHIYESALTIILAYIVTKGSTAVGKIEIFLVIVKMLIIAIFIVSASLAIGNNNSMKGSFHPTTGGFINSLGLCFFAYGGFGVIANVGKDLKNHKKNLLRAYIIAIGSVALIYIFLAFIVLSNLNPKVIKGHEVVAMALAAKPILGNFGERIITLAALFATISGALAMIYALMRSSFHLGEIKTLPKIFTKKSFLSSRGFELWLIGILALENFLTLGPIANAASVFFLVSYTATFIVAIKHYKKINAKILPLIIGLFGMALVVILFILNIVNSKNFLELGIIVSFIIISIILTSPKLVK
ncbi:MAG: APC family permease [Psittacicella sp.]